MFLGGSRAAAGQMLPCASVSVPLPSGISDGGFIVANRYHVCVVSGKEVAFANMAELMAIIPTNFARMVARTRISSKGEARFDDAVTNETQDDSLSHSDDSLGGGEDNAEIRWALFENDKNSQNELSGIAGNCRAFSFLHL